MQILRLTLVCVFSLNKTNTNSTVHTPGFVRTRGLAQRVRVFRSAAGSLLHNPVKGTTIILAMKMYYIIIKPHC